MLRGWVVGKGLRASGAAKWRADDGNQTAAWELQGREDVSRQLMVRFKNVNSDVRVRLGVTGKSANCLG